jgi:hypothetical protein
LYCYTQIVAYALASDDALEDLADCDVTVAVEGKRMLIAVVLGVKTSTIDPGK